MSYFDMSLADDTTIQVKKIRKVSRSAKVRNDSREWKGRKVLFGDIIPVIRKKSERRSHYHNMDHTPKYREASPLARTYVRDLNVSEIERRNLEHWSGKTI